MYVHDTTKPLQEWISWFVFIAVPMNATINKNWKDYSDHCDMSSTHEQGESIKMSSKRKCLLSVKIYSKILSTNILLGLPRQKVCIQIVFALGCYGVNWIARVSKVLHFFFLQTWARSFLYVIGQIHPSVTGNTAYVK